MRKSVLMFKITLLASFALTCGNLPLTTAQRTQTSGKEITIHFGFDPTDPTRISWESSLLVAIHSDGRAGAVLFDRDRSKVIEIYQGRLTKSYVDRLTATIRVAIKEANERRIDERVIRESDLFFLSLRVKEQSTKSASGKIEETPPSVRGFIEDLNRLWRSWQKVPASPAYVRARVIEKEELESLQRKPEVQFIPVESVPVSERPIVIQSIKHPIDFYPLTRSEYERLRAQSRLISHDGLGYVLTLYESEKSSGPSIKKAGQPLLNDGINERLGELEGVFKAKATDLADADNQIFTRFDFRILKKPPGLLVRDLP